MKFIISFLILIMSSPIFALQSYNLFVDCATTDSYFKCFQITEALKLKLVNGDRVVSTLAESNISLKLRTREVDDSAITYINVEQYYQLQSETTPFLIEIKKYRKSEVNVSTTIDLANHIVVHLARLRGVTTLEQTDKGVVVTFGKEGDIGSGKADVKDWYLQPSASLSWDNSVGQSSSIRVSASGEFVKAKAKSKFILRGNGSYYQQNIQFADGSTDEYQEVGFGLSTYYIRSLKNNKWSIAVVSHSTSNPVRDNINFQEQLRLGVEYNLVPFITKNEDKIFVIRYSIGPDFYDLNTVNRNDQDNFWILKHGITLASSFILNKYNHNNLPLKVGFSVGASSEVKSFEYAQLYASTNISYNITERIRIAPYYSINFANDYINQPKADSGGVIDEVNNAGRYASTQHYFYVTLSFSFGSSGLKDQDTRWSNL